MILFTAALATATFVHAEVLVYDGFPVGENGYASQADQNPTGKVIKHPDVIGFSEVEWSNNNTAVIYTHGSENGLSLPTFASAVTKGTAVGTSIGCHNAASTSDKYERVKYRALSSGKFDVSAVSELEDKRLHVRMLLKADEKALTNLKSATDSDPITTDNWYGAGFIYAASVPSAGTHTLLHDSGRRTLWFGFVKDKTGGAQVVLNVRGHDGDTPSNHIVTLCSAKADVTYLCYAEIAVNPSGADTVRAFALPVSDWSVGNASARLEAAEAVSTHLIDTDRPLNYLVVGGAYCTNSGRFAADEIGVATEAQDLIDLQQDDSAYFVHVGIAGNPIVGIGAEAELGNRPAAFDIDCYVGTDPDNLQLVQTWTDQTSEDSSWSYSVQAPAWGVTYYAKFVMTDPGSSTTLESQVVSCAPAATVTWTGESGDDRWETDGNWSLGVVPTANLDARFENTVTADVTHNCADSVKDLSISDGSQVSVTQGSAASLAAGSLVLQAGHGNKLCVSGGSFSVSGDTILGSGTTAGVSRADPVDGSNGQTVCLADGAFDFRYLKLYGNTYDEVNRFVVTNASFRMESLETIYNQNLSQGNVSFEAYDSVITNATHFQLHAMNTKALFQNCSVTNAGVIRLGQASNCPNEMRLYGTSWANGREVILGRKGNQYLEIGSGSSLTIGKVSSASESGNLLVGHGSDGGGTGTLVVSNALLTVDQNIRLPLDNRYGSQYMRVYETDGGTTRVVCQNLYLGSTGYNGSSAVRAADKASRLDLNGGTLFCSRMLSVGAIYETASNTLAIAGATSQCTVGIFALTNASVLAVKIPSNGFVADALIEVSSDTGNNGATGIATLSADSSIEIDASEFDSGTVTLIKAEKIVTSLTADEIAAKMIKASSRRYRVWFDENEQGEKIALKASASRNGFTVIVR